MMTEPRVMDDQQAAIKTLLQRFELFKKEPVVRRTKEKLISYENERLTLWTQIEAFNKILMDSSPPEGYVDKFEAAKTINEDFVERMKNWVNPTLASAIPRTPSKAATSSQSVYENTPSRMKMLFPSIRTQHETEEKATAASFQEAYATSADLEMRQLLKLLTQHTIGKSTLKPVELKLSKFDGDVNKFHEFFEQFCKIIENTTWSNIELFLYLKSQLSGEALTAIENLRVTDQSYELAWDILTNKYNNPRKILSNEIRNLQSPDIKVKYNNVASAKRICSTYQSMYANIIQLETQTEDYLVEMVLNQLDEKTKSRFEDYMGRTTKTPSVRDLNDFFEKEISIWESLPTNKIVEKEKVRHFNTKTFVVNEKKPSCLICSKDHEVINCDEFLSSSDRFQLLKKHRICIYCFKHIFSFKYPCSQRRQIRCDTCNGRHHNLLHPLTTSTSALVTQDHHTAVLPTAVAELTNSEGDIFPVRCLVDLCAERTYVCEEIVQKLRLPRRKTNVTISGINGINGKVSQSTTLQIQIDKNISITINALIVPKIIGTGNVQTLRMSPELDGLKLADPLSNRHSIIGALLGADISAQLFLTNTPNKITKEGLLLQPTRLGWIVSGKNRSPSKMISTYITTNETISSLSKDEELTKRIIEFYELPEPESCDTDELCERIFQENHYRLNDGRYVVPIPWKEDNKPLGYSFRKTLKMFLNQEQKLMKNATHYSMSNDFMKEYERLGHMSRIPQHEERMDNNCTYYIPYHSVIREKALTTKLRNVFNASSPTSNGISLNDTMLEGPKLQTDIRFILLTTRSFKYIYSADISMMFRQIFVHPEDRDKQRILWRPSNKESIREYRLNTVTYGTDAAPFLAIRTMHQCAQDNASPDIELIIKKAFYMDDLLYGADTIEEAQLQIKAINDTLASGKLPLTKWMTNDKHVLKNISTNDQITSYMDKNNSEMKLLGVTYDFDNDWFRLNLAEPKAFKPTKRGISSAAASFYDPIGFLLPFIMMLRIFLQNVWKRNVNWDDSLPEEVEITFKKSLKNILHLNQITIPRYIPCTDDNKIELIGFADASTHAQAAVVYSRIAQNIGYKINFIAARGNVAKLKTAAILESKQATIPKLELEALVTLTNLIKTIKMSLDHRQISCKIYTDSQVALSWVRNKTKRNVNFVERRVTKIRQIINPEDIHYVSSENNPADPASRGLTAEKLAACDLWFNGPKWLQDDILPTTPFESETNTLTTQINLEEDMFLRFSSWIRILRIVAYIISWKEKRPGTIHADEITKAKSGIIKYYQHFYLKDVINSVLQQKPVSKRHWLHNLSPFLDNDGILRVGGRLGNANISENHRHPIIFPKSHGLTLLIKFTHLMNGHASNSLMLQLLVQEFWIPSLRSNIKKCIQKCVTCIRWRAKVIQPEMAQLPAERVRPMNTFEKIGIDLCGPFMIKASPLRFERSIKVWVLNIVCLATKAIHLELITSLSTEHFLAAFMRFACRRGLSKEIWSDNGTNFVGANRLLQESWKQLLKEAQEKTAIEEINWKFIPRHSPTFGGLWEASVKSVKYFIKRMALVKNLTFEEFETLLFKIEALLNSRPLFANPLSPTDDLALTPFHFINQRGYKVTALEAINRTPLTKKWLMINEIQKEFWTRFKMEYLRELQTKVKWQTPQENLTVNDIVLIKEPSTTPGDWRMGKVTTVYPDPSGVVRKVNILTATKENTLHAVNQLVPLLKNEDNTVTPRKSPRLNKPMSLVALCLIIPFLPFSSSTPTNPFTYLTPGIHLVNLGQIHKHLYDVSFKIPTNINITEDLNFINQTYFDFKNTCNKYEKISSIVYEHCMTKLPSLNNTALLAYNDIKNLYANKKKRWIGPIIQIGKTILYAAPIIITTGMLAQTQLEVANIKKDLQNTKNTMWKAAHVILNNTDMSFEEMHRLMDRAANERQALKLIAEVTDLVQQTELIISNIHSRHLDLLHLKPYDELLGFAETLKKTNPLINIPDIGLDIFKIYPPTTEIINEEVVVQFKIPITGSNVYYQWALLSVPDDHDRIILLPNKQYFQKILVDQHNLTYADVTTENLEFDILTSTLNLTRLDKCMKNLFNNMVKSQFCLHEKIDRKTLEQIHLVNENQAFVLNEKQNHTKLICSRTTINLNIPAALVDFSECGLINGHQSFWTSKPHIRAKRDIADSFHEKLHLLNIPIRKSTFVPFKNLPDIINIKEELDNLTTEPSYTFYGVYLLLGCLVIVVIYVLIKKLRRTPSQPTQPQPNSSQLLTDERWFAHWKGPISNQVEIKRIENQG